MEYERTVYFDMVKKHQQEVTVFLLTGNRKELAALMIDCILSQTYDNFTLIVLDNNSVDGTDDMVSEIDDMRILYKRRESNLVNSDSNMRFAFEICLTEYLVVLHDDDMLEKDFLEKSIQHIKEGGYDAYSSGAKIIDSDGKFTGHLFCMKDKLVFVGDEYFIHYYSRNTETMVYPSTIYRRSFFSDYKKYITVMEAGPCNDQYLWFQMGRYHGKICMGNDNTYLYRKHDKQDSHSNVGFMDYMLIDYLMTQEYYHELINKNVNLINRRLFGRFLMISKMYDRKQIAWSKMKEVFVYSCVQKMKETTFGTLYYYIMKLMTYVFPIRKLILFIDKLRNRAKKDKRW